MFSPFPSNKYALLFNKTKPVFELLLRPGVLTPAFIYRQRLFSIYDKKYLEKYLNVLL